MMIENAASDRIIVSYPLAFLSEASPYAEMDFDVRVKNACQADRSIRIGLKISKTIFVGDVAVGKTCLVNRFYHKVFDKVL
ncbi:ras-related protein Rab-34-like [Limulus polyphemus]|uniref:Ras-related protein Rab-34-like n=1 Tax=Limulus polyphemus TaxID=6850 RepID=A0ABM1RVU4_LIMPO|nr:ras-related protein Rab-34-like [Limulus polyphemus]